jgi:hypothetical protein
MPMQIWQRFSTMSRNAVRKLPSTCTSRSTGLFHNCLNTQIYIAPDA